MAAKNIINSDEEIAISIGDFESKLSGLFNNTLNIVDIVTGELDTLYTNCLIFNDVDRIDFEFSDEDRKEIRGYASPSTVFILLFDENNPGSYAVHCMTVKELTDTIKGAYSRGEFVGNDIYRIIRKAEKMVCAKSFPNSYILKDLLSDGNCIIYRNDTPVIVTSETGGKFFFISKRINKGVETVIALDFGPKNVYSSVYDNPIERLYPFLKESKSTFRPDSDLAENDNGEYRILINSKDIPDKEIILNLSLNRNLTFTIRGVDIVEDYEDTMGIIRRNYNDRAAIINGLLDNRLSAHSAGLLDMID